MNKLLHLDPFAAALAKKEAAKPSPPEARKLEIEKPRKLEIEKTSSLENENSSFLEIEKTRKLENKKSSKVKLQLNLNIDAKRVKALKTWALKNDAFLGDALELAIDLLVNQKTRKLSAPLIGTDDLDDDDSSLSDHHQRVRRAYEDITENDWSKSDDDEYLRVRSIPAEDIIQHMLTINRRAKQTPGSFAYFVTGISKLLNSANQPRGAMKAAYEKIRDELAGKYQGADLAPSEFAEHFQRAVAREGLNWDRHLADEVLGLE